MTADESESPPDEPTDESDEVPVNRFYDALEAHGQPVITATQLARKLDTTQERALRALEQLERRGDVQHQTVETDPTVWYATDWAEMVDRERVVFFPNRRRLVVDQPTQFTRAQCSQFAHLVDTTRSGGYLYEIRQEDIWQAPYDDFEKLMRTIRQVIPERSPHFEEWVEDQWKRANQFVLSTHEEGYTVLEAASENLMGNVARQKLDDTHLRAPIDDTTSWVADEKIAEIKRILYEAGYPVKDERDLESGDELPIELLLNLRDYQQTWVDRFTEQKSGVMVGPPGSGKTVAAMGAMAAVQGETLILVPSRELASQWHEELLTHTSLTEDQIGEYHGGTKDVRPVTIATYQTAGMDRHRQLFDQRRWGLIVYDECQHIPSRVFRRSADLQSRHRLGLSATPVREDDKEEDIFTLVGPPIGTDWDALFQAGYVQEPEVYIHYVPWADEDAQNEHASADPGHEKRMLASMNPAKIEETRHLLEKHPEKKALLFVEYLDQGDAFAEALDAPFISGEMRHSERRRLLDEFRRGERRLLVISRVGDEGIDLPDAELAIVASGLGGSRRQGAQRAGRTMRPEGNALMYVLATRGTSEEDFANRQLRHLASKGVKVRDGPAEAVE
ncbi:DEAD/DEAH box helicase family protein [Haloarchaeobius sp. HME9146]|uniref:DEAD/DEAH box helicase family protein n=1 Tax=Haloarchaeobius sp. HME9146 TaxID=2978732 RepID=UPI0021BF5CD7|nr:DEAD/DEAH box helicase family protein [Haloarchaeobius sp. HME9146]